MSLATVGQDDFGVGMLRGVAPDVQPGVGLYNAVNGLFNDDGDVYRRGGTRYFSAALDAPLTFIWSGYLGSNAVILVASPNKCFNGVTAAQIAGPGIPTPVNPAIVGGKMYLPNGQSWTGTGGFAAWTPPAYLPAGERHLCAAAGRLLVAAGNRIGFSTAPPDAFTFVATDYHDLPDGVVVMGMTAIRDTAFVFTNYGLWTIANLAFDLTDAQGNIQQQLQLITPELSLWHESGLCQWEGRIVAPCMDRVYLIDGISAPVALSDSVSNLYMRYVRANYRPGGTKVFRNHLFLPIIDRATNAVQTLLVCRLNRPVKGRHLYYPWSVLTGHAAGMVAGDFSVLATAPKFLLAHTSGRIIDFTDVFDPSSSVAKDADGTTHEFDVETRDFPTGNGQPNHIRQIRLRYTLDGAATITAGYSFGSTAQTYGDVTATGQTYAQIKAAYATYEALLHGPSWQSGLPPSFDTDDPERFWNVLSTQALPEPGTDPMKWRLAQARRVRYARLRFRCVDAPSRLVVHHVDLGVRPATHDR